MIYRIDIHNYRADKMAKTDIRVRIPDLHIQPLSLYTGISEL